MPKAQEPLLPKASFDDVGQHAELHSAVRLLRCSEQHSWRLAVEAALVLVGITTRASRGQACIPDGFVALVAHHFTMTRGAFEVFVFAF